MDNMQDVIPETPVVPEAPVNIVGKVSGCLNLNIRKGPSKNSEVVSIIPVGTELIIAPNSVDKPWYRVTTEDGVKGFCMNEYITIDR